MVSSDTDSDESLHQRPSVEKRGRKSQELVTPRSSDVYKREAYYDNGQISPTSPIVEHHEKRPPLVKRGSRRDAERLFYKEMTFQTVPMLFLSLMGSVLAGEVLARFKFWAVFIRVEELFILIPILLNLKGNIEMNLSARFSTSANIGELDIRLTRRTLVIGNLALLQVQTLICSFVAGIIAFLLGLASRIGLAEASATGADRGSYFECLMILCTGMIASSMSSGIVGAFMCALVVLSRRFKINPDNIATPLASSLGDLLTLTVLGMISSLFMRFMGTFVSTVVFLALLGAIVFNIVVTLRNAYVQELLYSGWVPLGIALIISSGTGLVLQRYVNEFRGFGLLASVVTGVIGNVGGIFVSRIGTALHASRTENYWRTASTLFVISAPVLCLFLLFAWGTGQVSVSAGFIILYCMVICLVVAFTLILGYGISTILWKFDYDPDINALPLLTALTDVCGQLLLAMAFALTHKVLAAPTLGDIAPTASASVSAAIVQASQNITTL